MSGIDLSTSYLGIRLRSPLIVSASQPLSDTVDKIRQMEDSGAGAVVLYSLFEEQLSEDALQLHHHMTEHTHSFPEATSFFPEPDHFVLGPEEYLKHIADAKKAVRIPVIASLNGTSSGGWTQFAKQMEQAGADAIELNIYQVQTDPNLDPNTIEKNHLEIIKSVKQNVKIPVAVKLSPFFTNFTYTAKNIDRLGANGLVMFNRFYQPDIELEELKVKPDIILSTPFALRVPLRWIAILYGKVSLDLAATSGIHRAEDVIKLIMAGAKTTMLCSALIRYGINHLEYITENLKIWMEKNGYASIDTMRGSMSQMNCEHPPAFERAQYIRALNTYRFKRDN